MTWEYQKIKFLHNICIRVGINILYFVFNILKLTKVENKKEKITFMNYMFNVILFYIKSLHRIH